LELPLPMNRFARRARLSSVMTSNPACTRLRMGDSALLWCACPLAAGCDDPVGKGGYHLNSQLLIVCEQKNTPP
jgi:hypothetical protein